MKPDLDVWQRAVTALDEWACGYEAGRGKDDPTYVQVTEGRDFGVMRKHYSSCGDRAHWRLARIGVRTLWVNRKPNYRVGQNISLLHGHGTHSLPASFEFTIGDELIIFNAPTGSDAHSCSVLGLEHRLDTSAGPAGTYLKSANYGAGGMNAGAWPGARIATSRLEWRKGVAGAGWYLGTRRVQSVLRLVDIVKLVSAQPDLTGAAVTGEDIDALELHWKD